MQNFCTAGTTRWTVLHAHGRRGLPVADGADELLDVLRDVPAALPGGVRGVEAVLAEVVAPDAVLDHCGPMFVLTLNISNCLSTNFWQT